MMADSHVLSNENFVVQTGRGTVEFSADQIDQIVPLPDAVPALKPSPHDMLHAALASRNTTGGETATNTEELLLLAAISQGLEPSFVRSVARIESGLHQNAVSEKGALGLMQLLPGTAVQLGVDPKLADQNAEGGAKFLRQLLLRYNGDSALALAAYNAGPGAVTKYKGVPPYLETRKYIIKVLREYERQQKLEAANSKAAEPSQIAAGKAVAANQTQP